MSMSRPNDWKPSPEVLAAYVDGEVTDADEVHHIEAYLDENPESRAEVTAQRKLKALWNRAAPAEPSPASWQRVIDHLDDAPRPAVAPPSRTAAWALVAFTLAASAMWAWLLAGTYRPATPAAVDVLEVAQGDDIEILHIEGDDIASLVVGWLPLRNVLELANPGEIEVTSIIPASRDRMMPTVHVEGRRPMIYARLDDEDQ